jgi:hypothetical protein
MSLGAISCMRRRGKGGFACSHLCRHVEQSRVPGDGQIISIGDFARRGGFSLPAQRFQGNLAGDNSREAILFFRARQVGMVLYSRAVREGVPMVHDESTTLKRVPMVSRVRFSGQPAQGTERAQ